MKYSNIANTDPYSLIRTYKCSYLVEMHFIRAGEDFQLHRQQKYYHKYNIYDIYYTLYLTLAVVVHQFTTSRTLAFKRTNQIYANQAHFTYGDIPTLIYI